MRRMIPILCLVALSIVPAMASVEEKEGMPATPVVSVVDVATEMETLAGGFKFKPFIGFSMSMITGNAMFFDPRPLKRLSEQPEEVGPVDSVQK